MKPEKIDFYQEVEVGLNSKRYEYRGFKGVVLGVSEEGGVVYGYAVLIHGMDKTIYFEKDDLCVTGVRFSRGDFY